MKNGSITPIISIDAAVELTLFLSRKNTGRPTAAPSPKNRHWRRVRPKRNLVLIFDKSLGTNTLSRSSIFKLPLSQCAPSIERLKLLVLNRQKHNSTVYPTAVQIALTTSVSTAIDRTSTA